jgi:SAM-dependent methyltransferase
LLADCGLQVYGLDLSAVGISSAREAYGRDCRFLVGDATNLPFKTGQFDCIFSRSCSLYNSELFRADRRHTERLLEFLKPGGQFIFLYTTKLKRRDNAGPWRYHELDDAREHFRGLARSRCYFSLRFETLLAGRLAFSTVLTRLSVFVSRAIGVGGEIVVLVRTR